MIEQGTLLGLPGFNLKPIALGQAHSGKPSKEFVSVLGAVLRNWVRIVLIFKTIFTLNLAGYH